MKLSIFGIILLFYSLTSQATELLAGLFAVLPISTDRNVQYRPRDPYIVGGGARGGTNREKLFVFFPGTAASAISYQWILKVMEENRYAVIGLNYDNSTSPEAECRGNDTCYLEVRRSRIQAKPEGIVHRLERLLGYLGWHQFLDETGSVRWERVTLSGHSQGAGMAALLGLETASPRICQFSGTWDQILPGVPASWLWNGSGSAKKFFGFSHQHDRGRNGILLLKINWQALGMGTRLSTETRPSTNMVYTSESACSGGDFIHSFHNCSVLDRATPFLNERPRFENIWRRLCVD